MGELNLEHYERIAKLEGSAFGPKLVLGLIDRIRELEQDAGRYQHVRAHGMPKLCPAGYYYADGVFYETAEAAIDAARKEKGHG